MFIFILKWSNLKINRSFGKLSVAANEKWVGIFRQCEEQLGIVPDQHTVTSKVNIDFNLYFIFMINVLKESEGQIILIKYTNFPTPY